MAWGAGDIGGPLRKIVAGNPAAIHVLDNLARLLGVDVVDNTPDCPYTHLHLCLHLCLLVCMQVSK
jgi:hypothetical protein